MLKVDAKYMKIFYFLFFSYEMNYTSIRVIPQFI